MRRLSRRDVARGWVRRLHRGARRLAAAGDFDGEAGQLRHAAEFARRQLGRHDPLYLESLDALAASCVRLRRHDEALALLEEMLELEEAAGGDDDPNVATILDNLAELHRVQGRFADGVPLARRALEIRIAQHGHDHPVVAVALQNLARLFQQSGRSAEALPLFERALELRRRAAGDGDPAVAETLNDLADVHRMLGRPDAAVALHRRALRIRRAALGDLHPDTGVSLNNLGVLVHEGGRHRRAIFLLERSLQVARATVAGDDPRIGLTLHNLAKAHRELGNYRQAEEAGRAALAHLRATLGGQHPFTAACIGEMAVLHGSAGRHAEATEAARESLAIARRTLGDTHPQTLAALNVLGEMCRETGHYGEAIQLLRRSLKARRDALGERHPMVAAALSNLAIAYHETGRPAEALPLLREALEIAEARGDFHPGISSTLGNLADVLRALGRHDEAVPLLERAFELEWRELGPRHPRVGWSMSNLAVVLQGMGLHQQAVTLLGQALGLLVEAVGEEHHSVGAVLNNLGVAHAAAGDHARAATHLQGALAIRRRAVGDVHPHVAATLATLAASLLVLGRPGQALARALEAAAVDDRLVGEIFPVSSERERLAYLQGLRTRNHLLFSLVWRLGSRPHVARAGLDLALRRKAVAADALAAQRDAVLGGHYPALVPRLRELAELRARIARATLAGPGEGDPHAHRARLAEWNHLRDELEAELAREIPEMSLERRFRAVDRRAVAGALPAGSVLVELVRFQAYAFEARTADDEPRWHPARYLALVMHARRPERVKAIDLGQAGPIEHALAEFRRALTFEPGPAGPGAHEFHAEDYVDPAVPGGVLRAAVWDPLVPALRSARRIFIGPDGDLLRLPFEVLPREEGGHLLEEYRISYLSSGRDALGFGAAVGVAPAPPVVVANPDFDLRLKQRRRPARPRRAAGRRSRDLERGTLEFDPLPQTAREGEWIAALLGVEPWLGARALDRRLKELRSPAVLHLATHGLFLRDQGAAPGEVSADGQAGLRADAAPENPLLRSLLALAGANTWLRGDDAFLPGAAEDGLLTAEEVSGMDLLGTELVVLSACETGLGDVHTGEGVFGMRRAFVAAGARSLVMSLWKVPDEETCELMAGFYERLLAGEARADALRNAQLEMAERTGDPFGWGAFILQGDPGPLRLARGATGAGDGRRRRASGG
ncbi:MAG TPA: CHAT domain-containing tetratricopeptide repeat protein [Longimicrobium sp.]|nr:CHAT domain-containing tetratricopeptide repeat protein [Longimicrobium sp.]